MDILGNKFMSIIQNNLISYKQLSWVNIRDLYFGCDDIHTVYYSNSKNILIQYVKNQLDNNFNFMKTINLPKVQNGNKMGIVNANLNFNFTLIQIKKFNFD